MYDIVCNLRGHVYVCVYIFKLCMYYVPLYGGSQASDILHVLMGVTVAYVTNLVLLCVTRPHLFAK